MDQQNICVASCTHCHGMAGTDRNGLDKIASFLLEDRYQGVEKTRVSGAGCRSKNQLVSPVWEGRGTRQAGQRRDNQMAKNSFRYGKTQCDTDDLLVEVDTCSGIPPLGDNAI